MNEAKERFRQEVVEYILHVYPEWHVEPKDDFTVSVEVAGLPGSINLHNIFPVATETVFLSPCCSIQVQI